MGGKEKEAENRSEAKIPPPDTSGAKEDAQREAEKLINLITLRILRKSLNFRDPKLSELPRRPLFDLLVKKGGE